MPGFRANLEHAPEHFPNSHEQVWSRSLRLFSRSAASANF
jgi:hypothetical protein